MNIFAPAFKSRAYLTWVKSQPCVICGAPADDAHHIKGVGNFSGTGMTAPDCLTMPLCRPHHEEMHRNPELWPDQWAYVVQTINQAFDEGVIKVDY